MCKDYRGIQERVMNNGIVLRETQIQLPDINQTTFSQWCNTQQKTKEQHILKQGLPQSTQAAGSKKPSLSQVCRQIHLCHSYIRPDRLFTSQVLLALPYSFTDKFNEMPTWFEKRTKSLISTEHISCN